MWKVLFVSFSWVNSAMGSPKWNAYLTVKPSWPGCEIWKVSFIMNSYIEAKQSW